MICNIQKVETKRKYCTFKMSGDSHWAVVGKRIYGSGMEAFEIYKDDDLQYTLKQTNIIKQFISTVPLIGCFYTNPFHFYRNDEKCGDVDSKILLSGQGLFSFHFEDVCYRIIIHSNGVHSALKDGKQVALYRRSGKGDYSVLFSAKDFFKPDLLVLFAAFVEMFLTIDRRPALVLNANYIIGDQFINNTRWTPTDEE